MCPPPHTAHVSSSSYDTCVLLTHTSFVRCKLSIYMEECYSEGLHFFFRARDLKRDREVQGVWRGGEAQGFKGCGGLRFNKIQTNVPAIVWGGGQMCRMRRRTHVSAFLLNVLAILSFPSYIWSFVYFNFKALLFLQIFCHTFSFSLLFLRIHLNILFFYFFIF
jgi:hypothetical protein